MNLFYQSKDVLNTDMTTKRQRLLLLAATLFLVGCGQKTPLYLPSPAQQQALDEREARIKARKDARRNETAEERAAREARLEYGRQRAEEFRSRREGTTANDS